MFGILWSTAPGENSRNDIGGILPYSWQNRMKSTSSGGTGILAGKMLATRYHEPFQSVSP